MTWGSTSSHTRLPPPPRRHKPLWSSHIPLPRVFQEDPHSTCPKPLSPELSSHRHVTPDLPIPFSETLSHGCGRVPRQLAFSPLSYFHGLPYGTGGVAAAGRPGDLAQAWLTCCVILGSPLSSLAVSAHLRRVDQMGSEGPSCSERSDGPSERPCPWHRLAPRLNTSWRTPFHLPDQRAVATPPSGPDPFPWTQGQGKTRLIKGPGSRDLTLPSTPTSPHTRVPSPQG